MWDLGAQGLRGRCRPLRAGLQGFHPAACFLIQQDMKNRPCLKFMPSRAKPATVLLHRDELNLPSFEPKETLSLFSCCCHSDVKVTHTNRRVRVR